MKKMIKLFIILVIIYILYMVLKPFIIISIKKQSITKEQWCEDVKVLKNKLPQEHKNLFFNISKKNYNELFDKLINDIPSLNSDDIQIRLMQIIAKVGDAHTNIMNFGWNFVYPIDLYYFNDGYYIIGTDKKYKDLLGTKLIKINDISIDSIITDVDSLIPHENIYMLKNKEPQYVKYPQVLKYYNFTKNNQIILTLKDSNNKLYTKEILADYTTNINYININDIIKIKPLYLQEKKDFWYKYLYDQKLMYCQINRCTITNGEVPFINEVISETISNNAKKLVIDLRNNIGGTHFDSYNFVSEIANNQIISKNVKLYVIVGRKTFSAGLQYAIDFKKNTKSIFYGEPTSGDPNQYGDARTFILPNSKLCISYSTKYFNDLDTNQNSFIPNNIIEPSLNDYINGKDSVLEAIEEN